MYQKDLISTFNTSFSILKNFVNPKHAHKNFKSYIVPKTLVQTLVLGISDNQIKIRYHKIW